MRFPGFRVSPYAETPNPELALFVKGIDDITGSIEVSVSQGHKNAENLPGYDIPSKLPKIGLFTVR